MRVPLVRSGRAEQRLQRSLLQRMRERTVCVCGVIIVSRLPHWPVPRKHGRGVHGMHSGKDLSGGGADELRSLPCWKVPRRRRVRPMRHVSARRMDPGRLGGNGVRCGANTIADGVADCQPDRHSYGVADGCADGVSYGVAIARADTVADCCPDSEPNRQPHRQPDCPSDARVRAWHPPGIGQHVHGLRQWPLQRAVQRGQLHGLRQRAVLRRRVCCMQRLRRREVPPVDRQHVPPVRNGNNY
jgi:hypothetical protein